MCLSTTWTQIISLFSYFSEKDRLAKLTSAVKNSCLPKLICELNASQEKDKLNPKAKSLLQLIRWVFICIYLLLVIFLGMTFKKIYCGPHWELIIPISDIIQITFLRFMRPLVKRNGIIHFNDVLLHWMLGQ